MAAGERGICIDHFAALVCEKASEGAIVRNFDPNPNPSPDNAGVLGVESTLCLNSRVETWSDLPNSLSSPSACG